MLRLRTFKLFLAFLFTTCFSAVPLVRADFPPIPKEEMALKSVPEQPGASAVILFKEQTDDDKKRFQLVYVRLKVLTEAGRKYADVEVPYEKSEYTVEEIRGRTTHADGNVVKYEGKPLDKMIVKSKEGQYNAKVFTLPDVQPGSIIEYTYLVRVGPGYVNIPHWRLQDELVQRKIHYRYVPTEHDIMLDHEQTSSGMAWVSMLPEKASLKDTNLGYDLVLNNVPALVEEEMMPPKDNVSYYVNFYYRTKTEPTKYWKEQGKFWNKDVEKFMDKPDAVREALAKVITAVDTPEQKVRKIYAYINKLENTSYRPERSAQEEKTLGLKPTENVQDVLKKESGNRDELTRLFVAMVRAAGVPAHLMIVANRTQAIFEPKLLDWYRQLDAEIAIVELNGQETFLDPGTKYCPFGTVYWKYTASKGVRQMANGGTEIVDTGLPQIAESTVKRVGRFRLTDTGELQGNLTVVYMGRPALSKRIEGSRTDTTGREKILVDEVKSWLPAEAEISLLKQPVWDDAEKPLIAEFKVTTPALTNAGSRTLLPLNILQFGQKATFTHTERKHAVMFKYPAREVDELHVVLPGTFAVESIPANITTDLPYAIYRAEHKRQSNEIVSTRDLAYAILVLNPDKYQEAKGFFDKVKEGDDQQGVLRSVLSVTGN